MHFPLDRLFIFYYLMFRRGETPLVKLNDLSVIFCIQCFTDLKAGEGR